MPEMTTRQRASTSPRHSPRRRCPFCRKPFVPLLTVHVRDFRNVSRDERAAEQQQTDGERQRPARGGAGAERRGTGGWSPVLVVSYNTCSKVVEDT